MTPIVFPTEEADRLRALREKGDLPQLRARIKALRDAGWTLRSIGHAIESPHTTVKMWQLAADPEVAVGPPPVPVPPVQHRETVVRLRPDIPADEVEELRRLAASAGTVRGWTAPDAQSRKDAAELERRLEIYVARRVPIKRIAGHLNLTFRAVAARLERAAEKRAAEVKKSA